MEVHPVYIKKMILILECPTYNEVIIQEIAWCISIFNSFQIKTKMEIISHIFIRKISS